ncbi:uncharacterized protein CCR75_003420 [Bremia lactucae]|uniref:HIT domain-containing protein n=1 Tax=Bremia lactucae TaxID=4779 RepID=A0A976IIC1_BRELC|nr:hypothetical protein CCR75_003420 [Bremia lactucae]
MRLALHSNTLITKSLLLRCSLFRLTNRTMSTNERAKADAATAHKPTNAVGGTIFDKIINRQIPAEIVYDDEQCLAFHDVNPQAPVHILVIPKWRDSLSQLAYAEERHKPILGHLLYTAKLVAEQQNLDKGFRVVINDGLDGCQSIDWSLAASQS